MDPLAAIRDLLDRGRARRRSPDLDVWFLETGPWWRPFRGLRELEREKRALLAAVWNLELPLFFRPEEVPVAAELQPFLREHRGGTWRLVTTLDSDDFYATEPVSVHGNWSLFGSLSGEVTQLPDTFRVSPQTTLAAMEQQHIQLLIDCFHDDTDWCIALASVRVD